MTGPIDVQLVGESPRRKQAHPLLTVLGFCSRHTYGLLLLQSVQIIAGQWLLLSLGPALEMGQSAAGANATGGGPWSVPLSPRQDQSCCPALLTFPVPAAPSDSVPRGNSKGFKLKTASFQKWHGKMLEGKKRC